MRNPRVEVQVRVQVQGRVRERGRVYDNSSEKVQIKHAIAAVHKTIKINLDMTDLALGSG